jgi:hypothetical protein
LQRDPAWDRIRTLPAFQALVAAGSASNVVSLAELRAPVQAQP